MCLQFTVILKTLESIRTDPLMVLVALQEYLPELCLVIWEIISVDSTVNSAEESI